MLTEKIPQPPKLRVDWRAYFKEFMGAHGDPVKWGQRLLFRDGWQYSALDYAGPEFPPPIDLRELRQLQREYWKRRHLEVKAHYDVWKQQVDNLIQLSHQRGALPLSFRVRVYDEAKARMITTNAPLDMPLVEQRLESLKQMLVEAEEQLELIGADKERANAIA